MAITTRFEGLKGDKGDAIFVENLVQTDVAGSDVTFDLVQRDANNFVILTTPVTVQGGTAGTDILTGSIAPDIADGNVGDIYINLTTDELFKKVASDDWGTGKDFTGTKGDKGDTGDTGSAGSGFNNYDAATTYNVGDTVVSNDTQWRALTISTGVTPTEGDDWSELTTRSQVGAGGGVGTFEREGVAGAGTVSLVFDNVDPFTTDSNPDAIEFSGFTAGDLGFGFGTFTNLAFFYEGNAGTPGINLTGTTRVNVFGGNVGITKNAWLTIIADLINGDTRFDLSAVVVDETITLTQDNVTVGFASPISGTSLSGDGAGFVSASVTAPTTETTVVGQVFTQGVSLVYFGNILYFRTGADLTTVSGTPTPDADGDWSTIALT